MRLDDIVRIDIFAASQCSITIPASIPLQSLVGGDLFTGTPVLSLVLSSVSDTEAMMSEVPTIKVTNARQSAGNVYTHDIQAQVVTGRTIAETAIDMLVGIDFHACYTHSDGVQSVTYALPNSCTFDMEENHNAKSTHTVKIKMLSMSHILPITAS